MHLKGQLALSNPSILGLLNDCFALAGQDWRARFPSGTILWLWPYEQLGASTFKSCTALPHSDPTFSPDLKQLHLGVWAMLTLWVVWDIYRSGTCVEWLTWPFTPSSLCLLWEEKKKWYAYLLSLKPCCQGKPRPVFWIPQTSGCVLPFPTCDCSLWSGGLSWLLFWVKSPVVFLF